MKRICLLLREDNMAGNVGLYQERIFSNNI